ncbi:DENN domain-containing protein 3, partial [Ophiophagus hannah]
MSSCRVEALEERVDVGGFYITGESRENHFHFLVFTDVFGNRTYGVVAQYYQPVQEGRLYNGQAHWDNLQNSRPDSYFVPFAVCVISSLLLRLKLYKDSEIEEHIKEFAAKLSLIPSSPPGQLHLLFNMKPLQVIFPSQEDPDSPLIDLDLHLPFLCFKPEQILQILTCILTERKIVFFCSDWALLTLVSKCFMLYIHPIQWQHTEVKDHLNYEHRVFNSEEFLKTRAINDQPFYRK